MGQYPQADRKEMMMGKIDNFADSLQLDSLHKILFLNAYDQFLTQRFKLREKYSGDREKIREEAERLTVLRDASIKAILSDEQWNQYQVMLQEMGDKRRSRRR